VIRGARMRRLWLQQARAHLCAARIMFASGHPAAGARQVALAREARLRARQNVERKEG